MTVYYIIIYFFCYNSSRNRKLIRFIITSWFLVSVANELTLAIIARAQCEDKYNQEINEIVEIVADRDMDISNKDKQNSYKRVKKKIKNELNIKIDQKACYLNRLFYCFISYFILTGNSNVSVWYLCLDEVK